MQKKVFRKYSEGDSHLSRVERLQYVFFQKISYSVYKHYSLYMLQGYFWIKICDSIFKLSGFRRCAGQTNFLFTLIFSLSFQRASINASILKIKRIFLFISRGCTIVSDIKIQVKRACLKSHKNKVKKFMVDPM